MRNSTRLPAEAFATWWDRTGEYELRQLLFWRWDPIGVADDFPYATDEYDSYAPQIVQALRAGVPDDELAWQLRDIERDTMGLSPEPDQIRLRALVKLLRDWFETSQARWREFGPVRR